MKDKDLTARGEISNVKITYKPMSDRAYSTWTTDEEEAWKFTKKESVAYYIANKGPRSSQKFAIVLRAMVGANDKKTLLSCDAGLYNLLIPAQYSSEHEVLALTKHVYVDRIEWRKLPPK